ncbi:TIGR02281 family clan AA aspartic protease [Pelagibius sp. CAU 1746]|uniref:retropepsin-like aspartic protease family protein n=1 Tax=Pelagibius sp. CAU 1746 TaxID=3140370 RepID=UPI00325AB6C6
MSSLHEDGGAASGLLTHSLRLAVAVVVTGLVVMFVVEEEEPGARVIAVEDVTPGGGGMEFGGTTAGAYSELVLHAGAHGHFMVDAAVNGELLRFMVDTGASSIYLTPEDAERLGWPAQRLTFSERYGTAAGEVRAAPVTLRSLRIGQLELYDLPASVGEQSSGISLLGMSFLKRLESYQVRGDTLILSY